MEIDKMDIDSAAERRRVIRHRRRRRAMIGKTITLLSLVIVLTVCVGFLVKKLRPKPSADNQQNTETVIASGDSSGDMKEQNELNDQNNQNESEDGGFFDKIFGNDKADERLTIIKEAAYLAAGYDYDGAITLLQTIPDYASDTEITDAIGVYTAQKSVCVPVDVDTVPHIFYHSLMNDTARALNVELLGQSQVDGMNAWMTTVGEFDKITQMMYDNGYVFVRLRDLVVETTDDNGNVHFTKNTNLMLPPDKKAVVLSIDDLSYYHSYEKAGYPNKLVVDENGGVKCEYTDASGNTTIGDYDVVPRLNAFLEEHPDGAYKGARGLIAMTGYNGVFGYRTDVAYKTGENLTWDQQAWLDAHPGFNWDQEVAEAKKVADAIKASGWEFASHTWGHLSVTSRSVDTLRVDNEKWVNTVGNIVGDVDTIIFAHGNDIGDWRDYAADNEKFNYYKSVGYNYFCNVDGSTESWVQIRDNYVRQGRINLDGYMLYKAVSGQTTVLDKMFPASQVFDTRRPTPVVANGKG